MVQCVNDLPKIKDKTDSFYRRQIIVPFNKSFTGAEKKEIKDDYLNRTDVLEYVMKKIILSNYYELDVPPICESMLDEYKTINDPIREFFNDVYDKFAWNSYPTVFLYEMYCEWYKRNNAEGKVVRRINFETTLALMLSAKDNKTGWKFIDAPNAMRYLDESHKLPEPLIAKYNLTQYMNKSYSGSNIAKKCLADDLPDRARKYIERTNKI